MVKNTHGWTLAELMMVIAIVGILCMVAPSFLSGITKLFILGRAKVELQQEARGAMYIITRQLRQAQSNSIVIDRTGSQPYYSRIRFTKAQGNAVSLRQNGSSMILTDGVMISTMTRNLAYLTFTFPQSDDMTIVSVCMTLQKQIYGGVYKALHMASEKVRVMN